MNTWVLLERVAVGHWVDTLNEVDAVTWGEAVEQLLPGRTYNAQVLNHRLGTCTPDRCDLVLHGARYRVIAIACATDQDLAELVAMAAAEILRDLEVEP